MFALLVSILVTAFGVTGLTLQILKRRNQRRAMRRVPGLLTACNRLACEVRQQHRRVLKLRVPPFIQGKMAKLLDGEHVRLVNREATLYRLRVREEGDPVERAASLEQLRIDLMDIDHQIHAIEAELNERIIRWAHAEYASLITSAPQDNLVIRMLVVELTEHHRRIEACGNQPLRDEENLQRFVLAVGLLRPLIECVDPPTVH